MGNLLLIIRAYHMIDATTQKKCTRCGMIKSFDEFQKDYAIPHENNPPVFVCRRPKRPLKEIWPQVKCYSC